MDVLLLLGLLSLALLCFCAFQQIFFLRQIQKLVDKAMSRSFQEYQSAERPKEKPGQLKIPTQPSEDLRVMQEFQM